MEEKKKWFDFKFVAQILVAAWFLLLTFIVVYNFGQNRLDQDYRKKQAVYLQEDADERKAALEEHQFLRDRIIYLEGQIDALHKRQTTTPYITPNTTRP